MKRLILTISAVAALISCSKDETVAVSNNSAIIFDNAFVENSTRAIDNSYTNSNLTEFEVYGTITGSQQNGGGTANIFKQEKVQKGVSEGTGDVWKYNAANTQYWIAGNTYNFKAIADGNVSGVTEVVTDRYDMPTAIKLLDASKQKDILYAEDLDVKYTSGEKTVNFTFEHLMAKAKFTVKNAITTDSGYSYMVKNVKITNAAKDAVYTIDTGRWATKTGTYTLSFGDIVDERLINNNTPADYQPIDMAYNTSGVSNYERLIIPTVTTGIIVEFTCELYKSRVLIDKQTKTIQADNLTITKGNAYNFVISLGNPGEPIKFSVHDVKGWDTDHDNDGNNNDPTNIPNN